MSKFLSKVETGKRQSPLTVVLYGKEGIGKTTFIAGAPKPIIMSEPAGTDEIDVPRLPQIKTWPEALEALDELRAEKHDYQTFGLDTADWIEPLIWDYLCAVERKKNIEAFGYGKGYIAALDEWRKLVVKLEALRERGMNLCITAHASVRTFQNPEGDNYDRWEMKVEKKAAALLREWPKAVLFAVFETFTKKARETDPKAKAFGEGARMVHTEPRPSYDAKNRYGLPPVLPLSWADFEAAARKGQTENPDELSAQIAQLIESSDEQTKAQASPALQRCGADAAKLAKLADWLRGRAGVRAA